MPSTVSGWLLAGGQGQRMGGLDKGLQLYQERPLAQWVIDTLRPQVGWLGISANRHQADYEGLLSAQKVWPDASQWPENSGPLAGILTGLELAPDDWLMVCPCDSPQLPADLVARLLAAATADQADIATPATMDPDGSERNHWVCSLIHKRVYPKLVDQFVKGERKVGRFIQSMHWTKVSFDDRSAFANMNTLESLHGRV